MACWFCLLGQTAQRMLVPEMATQSAHLVPLWVCKSAGGAKPSIKNHRKSLQALQSANIESAACSDPQCGMLLHAKKMQQEAQQTARGQRHVDCGCACLLGLVQANRGCGKVLKAAKLMLADCFGKLCGGSSLGKRHSGSQAIRP